MPPTKPTFGGAGQTPVVTADYEDAGTKVLTTYAREEMSESVERLRRNLRTAFSADPRTRRPETQRPEQQRER